ncbi:MAG: AsmA family protein, partial [Deltaproteobacteria bacterium]|nr:AsmA family protein [Deltaproteobacteria bacterium]
MNRFLKWALICMGGLAALIILILLVLPSFYDIQSLKPRIEQAVQEGTGRDFAMGGDLQLSFFPWAGVTLNDVRLGNPDGFKETNFLSLSSFEVRMKLIPLLFKDLQVKHVRLKGLDLQLVTAKSGRKNWDFATKTKTGKKPDDASSESDRSSSLPISTLTVGEIQVADSRAVWVDHASGLRKEITDVSFQVDGISLEKPVQMSLSAKVDGKPISLTGSVGPIGSPPGKGTVKFDLAAMAFDTLVLNIKGAIENPVETPVFRVEVDVPEFSLRKTLAAVDPAMVPKTTDETVLEKIAFQAKLTGDSNNLSIYDGTVKLDDSTMTLQASVKGFDKPKIQWNFKLDQLDIDRYLPPPSEEKKKTDATLKPKG